MRWIHTKLFQVLKFVLILICELQYKFVCMVTLCITTRSLMYLKQLTVGSNQIHSGGG